MGNICFSKIYRMQNTNNDEELENRLNKCDLKNTPKFSLKDKEFIAKCVKVYDGDTITVAMCIRENEIQLFRIRLMNYDSPELNSNNINEKYWAKVAKRDLAFKILNKIVTVTCSDFDNFGRILGVVKCNKKNINDYMIRKIYTKKYSGGIKTPWEDIHIEL